MALNRPAEAHDSFHKANAESPADPDINHALGTALYRLGRL